MGVLSNVKLGAVEVTNKCILCLRQNTRDDNVEQNILLLLFSFVMKTERTNCFTMHAMSQDLIPCSISSFFPKSNIIHIFAVDVSFVEVNCLASWGEQPSFTERGKGRMGAVQGSVTLSGQWWWGVTCYCRLLMTEALRMSEAHCIEHAATWRHLTHMVDFHGHFGSKQGVDHINDDWCLRTSQ